MTEDRLVNILLVIGMAIIIGALILLIGSTAHGGVCLSKSEARHLWPKKHLYWYSSEHCWSNRRGGPPRGIKIDPLPPDKRAMAMDFKVAQPAANVSGTVPSSPAHITVEPGERAPSFLERWYEFPKVFSFFRRLVNP
jgi:hypothetical protein